MEESQLEEGSLLDEKGFDSTVYQCCMFGTSPYMRSICYTWVFKALVLNKQLVRRENLMETPQDVQFHGS